MNGAEPTLMDLDVRMPNLPRRLGGLLAALALLSGPSIAAEPGDKLAEPPTALVAGESQNVWSQRWWEWAFSFPLSESPIADRTGERCAAGQSGPVWFLAGVYGSEPVRRTCTIPRGKHLFFPLINYVVFSAEREPLTCDDATRTAKRMTDGPLELVAEINGQRLSGLSRHRFEPPGCFDAAARSGTGARIFPSAANGYYVMLKPLPPGRHTLRFGGLLPSSAQAVVYTLTVE